MAFPPEELNAADTDAPTFAELDDKERGEVRKFSVSNEHVEFDSCSAALNCQVRTQIYTMADHYEPSL